jgi:rhodanese-related sulfurtransferase
VPISEEWNKAGWNKFGWNKLMTHSPGFLKLVNDAKSLVRQTDTEGYKAMLARGETPVLIDTREDNEFAAGHVKGAVHLSRGIIERDIELRYPDKTTPMVLYCGGGFRSALVAESLGKMGYTNTISLDGGWKALKESGLDLE